METFRKKSRIKWACKRIRVDLLISGYFISLVMALNVLAGQSEILPNTQTDKIPISSKDFIPVKGGCFQMGNETNAAKRHEVCLNDFLIGKYEVTQGQWENVMGNNPSYFKTGDNYPVDNVSWNDVQEFIQRLNKISGKSYRLPTEAEWEYAARSGGKEEVYSGFSDAKQFYRYANFSDISFRVKSYDPRTEGQNDGYKYTAPVGNYLPNGLGIYDMTGNVMEWVSDWFDAEYYEKSPKYNPQGPRSGNSRSNRGGCYYSESSITVSSRGADDPNMRRNNQGFRIASSIKVRLISQ